MEHDLRQLYKWKDKDGEDKAIDIVEGIENAAFNYRTGSFGVCFDYDDDFKGVFAQLAPLLQDGSYIAYWSDDDYEIHIITVLGGESVEMDVFQTYDAFLDPFVEKQFDTDSCFHREDLPREAITNKSLFVRAQCKLKLQQGGSQ